MQDVGAPCVSAPVADILCITQITFVIVHNTLLANYRRFGLTHLLNGSSHILRFLNTGWRVWSILLLRSDNCLFTAPADFSSLKGKTTRWTAFSLVDNWACTPGFSDPTEVTNWEIVDSCRLDETIGVLKVSKHRLETITSRFGRLPCGRHVERTI